MRIRFWPKTGSGALYLKRREGIKIIFNEYFRKFLKTFSSFSYLLCQTYSASPRAPDPIRILTNPDWVSESRTSDTISKNKKRRLIKLSKVSFNKFLKISLRLRQRASDPAFD